MSKITKPDVFIIESLRLDDEKEGFFEGRALKRILNFSGKKVSYYYIRTKKELKEIMVLFEKSNYRYLHISCHGANDAMSTTFDRIPFEELAQIFNPFLEGKRLFFSTCSMVNINLAKFIINRTGCYSILGPVDEVAFDRAAIFWATFYHLMLRDNAKYMKKDEIIKNAKAASELFGIKLNYYSGSKTKVLIKEMPIGYKRSSP